MKAVVTGATGHLGVNLVDLLLAEGHEVTAVVRHRPRADLLDGPGFVRQVVADSSSVSSLRTAIRGGDVVFHLAGRIALVPDRTGDVWQTNVVGTRNVVTACLSEGIPRLVHCSSIHALNDRIRPKEPLDESFPLWQAGDFCPEYHRSKAEGERIVIDAMERGLRATIVRPTGVMGGRDPGPSRLGRVLLEVVRGELLALTTGAFDVVDARDVARAMLRAAEGNPRERAYMLGGHFLPLSELARRAALSEHVRPPPFVVPTRWVRPFARLAEGMARLSGREPRFSRQALDTVAGGRPVDSSSAERDLGHQPRPLEETLSDLYDYFRFRGWYA